MPKQRYVSDTLKKRKKKRTKIRMYILLALFVGLLYGIVHIIQLPQLQITQIEVVGLSVLNKEEIEKKIHNQLSKKILGIIPKSNIFLFSKGELYKKLIEDPAITHLEIKKRYFDTLSVQIEEHQKQTLYCRNDSYAECFYVNTEGMIYAQIKEDVVPGQDIIVFSENDSLQKGQIVLDMNVYIEVIQFIKSVAQTDIQIKTIFIKNNGIVELYTSNNVKIITSIFDEFEKDFINFIALFEQGILTKENFDSVEYLDLRFGNKVFYKNKTN